MKSLILDVAERAAWTFAQAFLSVLVIADLSTARDAAVAGVAAAVSVIKGFVASQVGDADAATLPASSA